MYMLHASRSHQQREGLQARISLEGFSPPPPVCVSHQYFSNSSRATSPNRAYFRQHNILLNKVVLVHMFFPAEVGRSFTDPNTKKTVGQKRPGISNTTPLTFLRPHLPCRIASDTCCPIPFQARERPPTSQTQTYLTSISKTCLFLRRSVPTDVVYKRFRRKKKQHNPWNWCLAVSMLCSKKKND